MLTAVERVRTARRGWPLALVLCLTVSATLLRAHPRARTPVRIPDIPGYRTLKCDFHIHTVFSDGSVWPDIRAEEAWREGLDAIAITDHLEYLPHKGDLSTNHNRSYEIARPHGEELQLLVIRGSEITRDMPPGHLNAVFLKDARPLATNEWRDSVKAARAQGAFIFWDHPGWESQLKEGRLQWFPEHTELLEHDQLHGVEVVNGRDYYPEAHAWCLEKNLTMLSNSDIHNPLNLDYAPARGDHRPITLVFAREATKDSIREALFDRRTAVYDGARLIGREEFLKPIFEKSVSVRTPELRLRPGQTMQVQVHNDSDVPFELERDGKVAELSVPDTLTLLPGKTVLLPVKRKAGAAAAAQEVRLPWRVRNLLVAPKVGLSVEVPLTVTFLPAP